jgi:hypothetical protein
LGTKSRLGLDPKLKVGWCPVMGCANKSSPSSAQQTKKEIVVKKPEKKNFTPS